MNNILFYGAGNMGKAVLKGLLDSGYPAEQIKISGNGPKSSQAILDELGVESIDKKQSFEWADVVILGIKPQIFKQIESELNSYSLTSDGKIIISLMAGVTIHHLQMVFGEPQTVVRTMPNLPINIGKGTTSICKDGLSQEAIDTASAIFNAAGQAVIIEERLIDSATALAGSLPAFVFQFAEGLIAGGVKEGMPRVQAEALVLSTLAGSAQMLIDSPESPSDLTTKVCSPGGTTIAGVHTLEQNAFKAVLMNTITATTQRSKELGQ